MTGGEPSTPLFPFCCAWSIATLLLTGTLIPEAVHSEPQWVASEKRCIVRNSFHWVEIPGQWSHPMLTRWPPERTIVTGHDSVSLLNWLRDVISDKWAGIWTVQNCSTQRQMGARGLEQSSLMKIDWGAWILPYHLENVICVFSAVYSCSW